MTSIRVGYGYDVHKLVAGRRLILGGCDIPFGLGLLGHSDADVLVHAIIDALLGAVSLGDIGRLFPDASSEYLNANSVHLLRLVAKKLRRMGYGIVNIDSVVVAQKPKLVEYIPKMVRNIASACFLEENQVSVKATTEEELGFTGEVLGMKSYAVCLIDKLETGE